MPLDFHSEHAGRTPPSWGPCLEIPQCLRSIPPDFQENWRINGCSYLMDGTWQQLSGKGWIQGILNEIFFFNFLPPAWGRLIASPSPSDWAVVIRCWAVACPKAAVCFLVRACAWPWIDSAEHRMGKELESSFGFWQSSKLLLYRLSQDYVCINTNSSRSFIWCFCLCITAGKFRELMWK